MAYVVPRLEDIYILFKVSNRLFYGASTAKVISANARCTLLFTGQLTSKFKLLLMHSSILLVHYLCTIFFLFNEYLVISDIIRIKFYSTCSAERIWIKSNFGVS